MPREELPQESPRAHPRGAPGGFRAILEQIASLTERIRYYERQLESIAKEHYPETELLRQVEGIGPLTALTFVLTLEDPYRFERSRSVGEYLWLVPASDHFGGLHAQAALDPQRRPQTPYPLEASCLPFPLTSKTVASSCP
jgi:transposase